jgi:hypothetical protein
MEEFFAYGERFLHQGKTLARLRRELCVLPALRDDQSDVIVLFLRAEVEDFVDHRGQGGTRGEIAMEAKRVKKARLSEFVAILIERFGDAVGVEREHIARC